MHRHLKLLLVCAFAASVLLSGANAQTVTVNGPHFRPTQPYQWQNVQIVGGGFVDGIIGSSAVPGLVYARTDIGGAYRYDAQNQRWIPITDFLGIDGSNTVNLIGIESIALDPTDPDRVYLAGGTYTESFGGDGAIMVSDDRGQHFRVVGLPIKLGANDAGRFAGERLSVDPNHPSLVYFGSRDNGLWSSQDRGNNWAQVTNFPVTGTTGTPSDPGVGVVFELFAGNSGTTTAGLTKTVYAGVSDPAVGIYVTHDGGRTWAPLSGQPTGFYVNSGLIMPDGTLYLCYGQSQYGNSVGPYSMTNGAIWKYAPPSNASPSGTWTNITPPKPSYYNWGYGSVAVDPNHPNVIMVTTMDRYYPPPQDDIYRSLDGGQTWESLETNAQRNVKLSPWVTFGAAKAEAGNWMNHLWIDPFDSNHVMYGDGQTIWSSNNISAGDTVTTNPSSIVPAGPTNWNIGALGIEETADLSLISPASGPAHLLSGLGDIGGFTHVDFHHSPPGGMMSNPIFGGTTGLDFAQKLPLNIVRVGSSGTKQYGAYSGDGGLNWAPFATMPPGVVNGSGTVAYSADAAVILWQPGDAGTTTYYSLDTGTTWTASTGLPAQKANQNQNVVFTDRVNPKKAYLYVPATGALYVSTDAGQSFSQTATLATYGTLAASSAAEGDLWLASGSGLSHSTNSGLNFTPLATVESSFAVGFGKSKPGAKYQTIFILGQVQGTGGFFRSTDEGMSWVRINDDRHQFGNVNHIIGDPRIYGRVYVGVNGRGVLYGDPMGGGGGDDHHDRDPRNQDHRDNDHPGDGGDGH